VVTERQHWDTSSSSVHGVRATTSDVQSKVHTTVKDGSGKVAILILLDIGLYMSCNV
jgi:hypothetical protein